jgi:hypothetical protein
VASAAGDESTPTLTCVYADLLNEVQVTINSLADADIDSDVIRLGC